MGNAEIGRRLKAARESVGLTQAQVAEYLKWKREMISYVETGSRPITMLALERLAHLYGYKLSYFVEEGEKEEEGRQIALAFRSREVNNADLSVVAEVEKIAMNLDSLYKLVGQVEDVRS